MFSGELKHIQTLRLENETSDLLDFTSIIVTRDGSELLAISVNEEESSADFVTLALQPTGGGRYNILQATINPMLGPNGQPLVISEAPNRLRGFRGDLLAVCSEPLIDSPIPRVNPTADIYSGGVYNDRDGIRRFFVESTGGYQPSAVAQLRNGDIMIAFVRGGDVEDEARSLRIGYVTADELREDIASGGTLNPLIIADFQRNDGFNIAVQSGLAVREDNEGRVFVYSMSDDFFTLLTTFEWRPKRRRHRR
ncbi:hypothetical protein FOZ61_010241 [Perkinsus olseni]|uniref:Uncharacterized protein n=1 Tax=Perkinsus olseni TaxID=32597 RepID=A0A7J6L2Y8_PEROL|nr:hypothetical protein FOZ61_010241 [Perkinsus olseni]KAF4653517.1 hypothetical protein FOL46_009173 [Perkinsus olseni]